MSTREAVLDLVEQKMQAGEIAGLTVFRSGDRWQASARWEGSDGWCAEIRENLTDALQAVLETKQYLVEDDDEDLIG